VASAVTPGALLCCRVTVLRATVLRDSVEGGKRQMKTRPLILAAVMAAGLWCAGHPVQAETVFVKYRGAVDLAPFACNDITRSSFINRVCYDHTNAYMLISLNGTYYHYCGIGAATVSALLAADSMGRFYNASVKGNFDCRVNRVPAYDNSAGKDE
jgi:hypothetical protein